QWRGVIESARDERKRIEPGRYIEVRYEDFLDDPHAFLTSLFARCGLPDAPAVHEHVDSGPPLSSMNRKFESELTPSYVNRLTASMQPVIGQLNYAPPPNA
ncbi:MAG: sulfotransferase, partial [Gammaproteobacteria bacterium]